MSVFKRGLPVTIAVIAGLATLVGLLLYRPLSDLILGWAAFLAAVALIVGVINLLTVHARRARSGNAYSLVLVLSMLAVFALAVTDALAVTENSVRFVFHYIQAPLEAALASLLAFFLLFAGVRLLQERRSIWSLLFLVTAVLVVLSQSPLPGALGEMMATVHAFITDVLVMAGVRGLLFGIALGTITLSLRLLAGIERPYSS
jgi:hypothetical protein